MESVKTSTVNANVVAILMNRMPMVPNASYPMRALFEKLINDQKDDEEMKTKKCTFDKFGLFFVLSWL